VLQLLLIFWEEKRSQWIMIWHSAVDRFTNPPLLTRLSEISEAIQLALLGLAGRQVGQVGR